MLGCHTLVSNFIIGGCIGYYLGIMISMMNLPFWYMVYYGPFIIPFQCEISPSINFTCIVYFYNVYDY
jgi:hypothetical protein